MWDEYDETRLEKLMRDASDPDRPAEERARAWQRACALAERRRLARPPAQRQGRPQRHASKSAPRAKRVSVVAGVQEP